jgi:hypothetical protein
MQISENYFSAKQRLDHLAHFFQWTTRDSEQSEHDKDSLTLLAPVKGYMAFGVNSPVQPEQAIASFVMPEHRLLKLAVPAASANRLESVQAQPVPLAGKKRE